MIYLGGTIVLDAAFLYDAVRLIRPPDDYFPMGVFTDSIVYLMALFVLPRVDHWVVPPMAGQVDVVFQPVAPWFSRGVALRPALTGRW